MSVVISSLVVFFSFSSFSFSCLHSITPSASDCFIMLCLSHPTISPTLIVVPLVLSTAERNITPDGFTELAVIPSTAPGCLSVCKICIYPHFANKMSLWAFTHRHQQLKLICMFRAIKQIYLIHGEHHLTFSIWTSVPKRFTNSLLKYRGVMQPNFISDQI